MRKKRVVALATCREMPEPDRDQALLLAALAHAGVEARMLAWDESGSVQALREIALCVVRSTWNYHLQLDRFRVWLASAAAATRLENPLPLMEWNLHKRYLLELEESGVPTVPSVFLQQDTQPDLARLIAERDWKDFVIKPAVSAASYKTQRFTLDAMEEAQAFMNQLLLERDSMVQRTIPSAEIGGERCLIQLGGEWSHVVEKQARFQGAEERVSTGRPPTREEIQLGERALACSPAAKLPTLYARVDMFACEKDELMISELELIEPSLYFAEQPAALTRFVDLIVERLDNPG
ncbi:MAG: hypothetical protein ACI841_004181 [Planctomycetota bacterium]|jgi:hypothetical protein